MKKTLLQTLAILVIGLPTLAVADPIEVTYDVGKYYSPGGGYSASWVHLATGCKGTGSSGETLYMCGKKKSIGGTITGLLDHSGVLTITGGLLTIPLHYFDLVYDDISGSLGGNDDWTISIAGLGNFLFEDFGMGPGGPNSFDGSEFVLWGQNEPAYRCRPNYFNWCGGPRLGLDLYGSGNPVHVPEPGTLALFGIGLLGLGLVRRRRRTATL